MNKPNFLGIGSVRGGSTWLYELLNSHPDFYFPAKRKEIQFFTRFYNKGETWYRNLFYHYPNSPKYQGEFTPGYLAANKAPERIKQLNTVDKFIVILRNPVERTYSHYKWHLRVSGQDIDFKNFLNNSQRLAIENGLYFKYLTEYLKYFSLDQFLILFYEEVIENPEKTLEKIGSFFDVDAKLFNVPKRSNASVIPKYRKLFNLAHKFAAYLRKKDLDLIPNIFIDLGIKRSFGNTSELSVPKLTKEERIMLYSIFREDIGSLELLLNRSLEIWTSEFKSTPNI